MKTALVMGPTGLIGSQLLNLLLEEEIYGSVKVLTRRKIRLEHEKLIQIRYDYEWPESGVVQADHVYCCLGTTIKKAGSQEAFKKIDHDYVIETAQEAKKNGAKKFILVSSLGADIHSKIFYTRIKGEIEAHLAEINYESLHILRPSLLLGSRDELRMGELIGAFVNSAFNFAIPQKYKGVEAIEVAKAMLIQAKSDLKGKNILESQAIRALIDSID